MNITNLQPLYKHVRLLDHKGLKEVATYVEPFYLKPLAVVCTTLLKNPHLHQDYLQTLWLQLPFAAKQDHIDLILNNIFNAENIDTAALPPKLQTLVATALVTNTAIPWIKVTKSLLTRIIDPTTTYSPEEKRAAQLGLLWLLGVNNDLAGVQNMGLSILVRNQVSAGVMWGYSGIPKK